MSDPDVHSQTNEAGEPVVLVERPRPGTAVIRMNRPERMNSMAFELMVPLAAVFDEIDADNDITCVVLTGTGSGFCSGADTRDTMPPPNIDGLGLSGIATKAMATLADLVPRMRRMNKPIIAAINGAAIGGGMCLTLGADIVSPANPPTSGPPASTTVSPQPNSACRSFSPEPSARHTPSSSCCRAATSTPRKPPASGWSPGSCPTTNSSTRRSISPIRSTAGAPKAWRSPRR
jgi:hypothetical protein